MRIAYCVRAGEAATIQLLCSPEEYRFQTGFRLDAIALIPQQTEVDKCIGTRYTIARFRQFDTVGFSVCMRVETLTACVLTKRNG